MYSLIEGKNSAGFMRHCSSKLFYICKFCLWSKHASYTFFFLSLVFWHLIYRVGLFLHVPCIVLLLFHLLVLLAVKCCICWKGHITASLSGFFCQNCHIYTCLCLSCNFIYANTDNFVHNNNNDQQTLFSSSLSE